MLELHDQSSCGVVVITADSEFEDRGFNSRQELPSGPDVAEFQKDIIAAPFTAVFLNPLQWNVPWNILRLP